MNVFTVHYNAEKYTLSSSLCMLKLFGSITEGKKQKHAIHGQVNIFKSTD